jgi:isopenicillin N synthase-like dioxygenase
VELKKCFIGTGGSATAGATYSGLDAGQAEPAYDPNQRASVRSWDFARPQPADNDVDALQWPTPAFLERIDDLYDRQNLLGMVLLEAFAEVLELPRETFAQHFEAGDMGTIRLLSYPGEEQVDGDLDGAAGRDRPQQQDTDVGIAPHTDFEVFTLMHQSAPGLQFLTGGGNEGKVGDDSRGRRNAQLEWVDAPVVESDFVVIVGDVLERYTNGVLKATPHRVRPLLLLRGYWLCTHSFIIQGSPHAFCPYKGCNRIASYSHADCMYRYCSVPSRGCRSFDLMLYHPILSSNPWITSCAVAGLD